MGLPRAHSWDVADPRLKPRQLSPEPDPGLPCLAVTLITRQTWAHGRAWGTYLILRVPYVCKGGATSPASWGRHGD